MTTRPKAFLVLTIMAALGTPCLAQEVVSTLAFTSTRDDPTAVPQIEGGDIYFIDVLKNGTLLPARRITTDPRADLFPALSPDGKGKIVFVSSRQRAAGEPTNTSDLFLMNHEGGEVVFLTRGASAAWAPPGPNGNASKTIAFQASASGTGLPVLGTPASATSDSDIFVVNVDELLENGAKPVNITNHPNIDDDPDWSPDGRKIAFTSHSAFDDHMNALSTEIYIMNPDGTEREQITFNAQEERAPAWSPDGKKIVYMCRKENFEICVMNVETREETRLTKNDRGDFTPSWSPDGERILFHRSLGAAAGGNQLFIMNKDGDRLIDPAKQLTSGPGINLLASWGVIEVGRGKK